MNLFELLFFSLALGTDTFPLAVGISNQSFAFKHKAFIVLWVAVLYTITPPLGIWLGEILWMIEGNYAKIFGALLLIVVGSFTIASAVNNKSEEKKFFNSKTILVYLAVLSFESTCVGFSLGTLHIKSLVVGLVLGFGGTIMMILGICFGNILNDFLKRPEILSGSIMIILGLDVLFKRSRKFSMVLEEFLDLITLFLFNFQHKIQ